MVCKHAARHFPYHTKSPSLFFRSLQEKDGQNTILLYFRYRLKLPFDNRHPWSDSKSARCHNLAPGSAGSLFPKKQKNIWHFSLKSTVCIIVSYHIITFIDFPGKVFHDYSDVPEFRFGSSLLVVHWINEEECLLLPKTPLRSNRSKDIRNTVFDR